MDIPTMSLSFNYEAAPSALILDADNTLWDTNSVFEGARRQMISALLEYRAGNEAVPEEKRYRDVVRQLGKRLSLIAGQNDLALLARGMAFFLSEGGPSGEMGRIEWAAQQAEDEETPKEGADEVRINAATEAFRRALDTVPPLLEGAEELLLTLRDWKAARPDRRHAVLFSEGDPDRLAVAFEAYEIGAGRHFDDIVLREKTLDAFKDVRQKIERALDRKAPSSPETRIVVLGDSLKRDIRPANEVGCTTVYCPGAFKGHETPEVPAEAPDHTVSTLNDALDVLGLSPNAPQ